MTLAMAGLLLGACSSDELVPNAGQGNWNANEQGYISVGINLPTRPASKAANDQFDDGTAAEYAVTDATLILFKGNDEATATATFAYNMPLTMNAVGDTPNQITTAAQIVQKIDKIEGNLYALVVLNKNGLFTIDSNTHKLMIGGTAFEGTVAELNTKLATAANTNPWNSGGFLMTNAPLYDGAKVVTLADVNENLIFGTEAEAKGNPACKVFVERAQAKVTVNGASGTYGTNSVAYEIVGWQIDNKNTHSNLVRNVDGLNWNLVSPAATDQNSRMIGTAPVGDGSMMVRTYWAKDLNYHAGTEVLTPALDVADEGATFNAATVSDPAYCFENTMQANGMTQSNTTRVIVKAKIADGTPFYVLNGDRTQLFTAANMKAAVINAFLNIPEIMTWYDANAKQGSTFEAADFDITFQGGFAAPGKAPITAIALTASGQEKLKEGAEAMPDMVARLNEIINVDYYDGTAYYAVYLKHFGDDLTPWNTVSSNVQWDGVAPSSDNVYPGDNDERNVLGRYGVVRNNWYDVNVTAVKGLGTSTIPQPDSGIIDRLYDYISVKINVLSWAKRTQNAELQ